MKYYLKNDFSVFQSDLALEFPTVNQEDVESAFDGSLWLRGHAPEATHEQIRLARQNAFAEEADPLKYNYEEDCARYGDDSEQAVASKQIWLAKKDEIRERYPYPDEEEE